ncbi:BlaI/MecI/CopY family transcriptional regulator [Haloechinothrix sp. LS1_15]|uniref:BlaI/MecI/CopY family transcriptional regulator n=1 Tax=Haloechinothrix sp. LS1_15 TaxID=2652248 RepID=UPI00294B8F19|nr:BlaI/MecI/CopY family transcriptional regulator [Haloechinothrix sp. LS1_15]
MRGFGELESAIMDVMWSRDEPATVREVLEELQQQRDLAYTTVMTVMGILHDKGWLRRERAGRAWRYEPTMSREAYAAHLMREALAEDVDAGAVFTHFVEQASPEESRALRAALGRFLERSGE